MTRSTDEVGQPIPGLPDFVDPADVERESLEASQQWGSDTPVGSDRPSGSGESRAGTNRRRKGPADNTPGTSSGRSPSQRGGRRSKHLSWEEKRARRERKAAQRAEQEAAEREKDPVGFAREIVLTQLTAAPRSRGWLESKLRDKEISEEVIEAVLDRMEDVGLVDDVEYAGMLVRSQVATRGLARRALAQELRRKGVREDAAEDALAQVTDDDERVRAHELATKKMATMGSLDPQVQTRRLAGLLARKGYGPGIVWSVVKQVQDEARDASQA